MDENNTNPTDRTTNNFTSNTTNNVNNVLLQTAKATATDLNDLSFANIQIMFDSGSQRVYVNEHLKQILNLKTLRTEKLILKTFGNEKPSEKLFDVVKIKLNGVKKDFVTEALVVPQICSPITNQMVTRVSQNYPHLKNLRLADSFDEQLLNRSSRPEVFCEKGVLRNFAKFTGKHLCQSLFFNKVAGGACNFIKKETLTQVFYKSTKLMKLLS